MISPIRSAPISVAQTHVVGPHLVPHAGDQIRAEVARIQHLLTVARMDPQAYARNTDELKFLQSLFIAQNPKNHLTAFAGRKIVAKTAEIQHLMTVAMMTPDMYKHLSAELTFLQSLVQHRG
jgi:hypothetical protein